MGNLRKRSVEQVLQSLDETMTKRGEVYERGGTEERVGNEVHAAILRLLFPEGFGNAHYTSLETVNRFVLFNYALGKFVRYALTLQDGGHEDSAKDLAGYAVLLASTHEEGK